MASHGLPMYMTGYPTTSYNQIRKKRELKLNPYLEAVGIARIMEISLEPTLSREQQKPYRYHYTVSCEFPTFPDTIDNQLLPLLSPSKIFETATLRPGNPCPYGQVLSTAIGSLLPTAKII